MRRRISLGLFLGALLSGGPAFAQPPSGRTELEEMLGRAKTAPVIPAALRPLVRESHRDRIVVRGLSGSDILVDIGQREPELFHQFAEGRFFGFSFIGYEHYGYVLVDRAASGEGAIIETGATPAFSPDGRYLAAAQLSGADAGGLEGVGLWEVRSGETAPRFFTDALPDGADWRIDGWASADCVRFSAVAASRHPPQGQERDLAAAPRIHFAIEVGERIALIASGDQRGCGGGTAGEDGDG